MITFKDLTLGIEEEYQIIDPDTRELTSFVQEILDEGQLLFADQVKPEFMQSQVESGSVICHNVDEARDEICRLRRMIADAAAKKGRKIIAAGTHPFSRWQDQMITEGDRYQSLLSNMQQVARRLLIFGMHVHVGIPDPDLRIDLMNQMTYFMPHILALSTSSPFWLGEPTGMKSYRAVVFQDLPRTGLPEYFDSYRSYQEYVQTMINANCIDEPTKIWWDIRPHPKFPTLEFRICDCCTRVEEVIAIAALLQALVAKLVQLRQRNQTWRIYRSTMIGENKWRALRNGIQGKLVDFGRGREIPFSELMEEALELVDDVLDELGSRKAIDYIQTMLKNGTSADRQLAVYKETGDIKAVVDMLAEQTLEGC